MNSVIESSGNVSTASELWLFKEKLTKRRIAGIVCIMAGIAVFYS